MKQAPQQRQQGRFALDTLPRYSDEMRLPAKFSAANGCRTSAVGSGRPATSSDLDHQACNVHVLQTSVQPLRVCVVAVISCVAVCAALVLATVAVTWWDSGKQNIDHEHLHPAYRRPLARLQHYEKYANGRPYEYLHPFGRRPYGRRDDAEEPDDVFVERKQNKNSPQVDTKLMEDTKESVTNLKSNPAVANSSNELPEKGDQNFISDYKHHYRPEQEYDLTLSHLDRRIEKKDQPVFIPEFKPSLPEVTSTKESTLAGGLPAGYLAGLRKYDEDYYESAEYLYSEGMDEADYYGDDKNTVTSYLIQKVKELYNWITNDPDLEGPGRLDSGNNDFSDILTALNDSIVLGNVSIVFAKIRQIYETNNGNTEGGLKSRKGHFILSNSSDLVSLGLLALDVMLLHNVQLLAWDEQRCAKEEMLSEPEVFAFNAIFIDPQTLKPLVEEFQQNRQMAERKRLVEVDFTETEASPTASGATAPMNRSVLDNVLEDVLDLGLSTARAALYLSRAYNNARAAFRHAKYIQHRKSGPSNAGTAQSPQMRSSVFGHKIGVPLAGTAGRFAIKIDGKVALDEDSAGTSGSFSKNDPAPEFTELDCMWNLYCKNLDRTSKLTGPYGMLAKINGLGLRLLVGEFPIEQALDTLLVDALAGWRPLDCDRMFPKCSGEFASKVILESLIGQNKSLPFGKPSRQ